jgi:hypothetical protein
MKSYGVDLLVVSDNIISIPPLLTAAKTDLEDPISTPI